VQKRIVADIILNSVRYIVLSCNEEGYEPNKSSESSGIMLLDTFLRQRYVPVKVFGYYVILKAI